MLSFSILSILLWQIVQYWPISVQIRGLSPDQGFSILMPRKEKKSLDYFFRDACFLNGWAYTLLGSKAVVTHQYVKPWVQFRKVLKYTISNLPETSPNFFEFCYLFNPVQFKIKKGLAALNKHLKLIPDSNFALFSDLQTERDIVSFTLVNKTELIRLVNLHSEDFLEVLMTLGVVAEDLHDNKNLNKFLNILNEDRLIGILLGFGKKNAYLYQKYRKMNLEEWPMVSMWADEDEEWQKKFSEKELSFEPWDVSDLYYPYCACDPESEETKQLKRRYREERKKIVEYFQGKDVVEATLSLFHQK